MTHGERSVTGGPSCMLCMRSNLATRFALVPAAGGGWTVWAAALARLLARLSNGLTTGVCVSQTCVTWAGVSVHIGHGRAYARATSDLSCEGHQLTKMSTSLLERLGWLPDHAPPSEQLRYGAGWHMRPVDRAWEMLADSIRATIGDVMRFRIDMPVEVDVLDVLYPCEACQEPGAPFIREDEEAVAT